MINRCFEIFSKMYAFCASGKDGLSFSEAARDNERLLSFIEGDGVLEEYLRKCVLLFSKTEYRAHFLTAIEYSQSLSSYILSKNSPVATLSQKNVNN